MTETQTDYEGETSPRKAWVARTLTYLCPGLGYIYAGQFIKGLTVNLVFLLALEVFVIALSMFKFFPLVPALVLVAGYVVFCTLLGSSVAGAIDDRDEAYVLKGYNHWTLYAAVFMLSWLVPVAVTYQFTTNELMDVEAADTAAMYPTIQSTDSVLIDRTAYRAHPPKRGDIVALEPNEDAPMRMLRVVGVKDDIVRVEQDTLYVNEEPVQRVPLEPDQIHQGQVDEDSDLIAWVEINRDERYVISVSPRAYTEMTMEPIRLGDGEYFLLADNRSKVPVHRDANGDKIRDSRNFGAVSGESIAGKPLYIAWSYGPETGIRWDRIGLRVQ